VVLCCVGMPDAGEGIAAAATAIAACLSLAVGWFLYERIVEPTRLVAELYAAAGTSTADEIMHPAFVVSVKLDACAITARPVTAQPRPGTQPTSSGSCAEACRHPESLGVLQRPRSARRPLSGTIALHPSLNATLAVSQETRWWLHDRHTQRSVRLSRQAAWPPSTCWRTKKRDEPSANSP
jgi:hypothetical protein